MTTPTGAQPVIRRSGSAARLLPALLVGAAISVVLGVYGREHDPTGRTIATFGFSGMINMKFWLSTVTVALALVQVSTALRMFGRVGSGAAAGWVTVLHRTSGTLAVVVSAPVAFHCLWSLGFATFDTRTTVHSLLGCAFYGAFVAKMLMLKTRRLPGWAVPVIGGLTFTVLVGVWLTSAVWYLTIEGVPGR